MILKINQLTFQKAQFTCIEVAGIGWNPAKWKFLEIFIKNIQISLLLGQLMSWHGVVSARMYLL